MSRRHRAEKREINPDPKFGDLVISKFMNCIMKQGKKSVAETIVYGALDRIQQRAKSDPLPMFHQALENVMPWFAQGSDAADGTVRLRRRWLGLVGPRQAWIDWDVAASRPTIEAIAAMHERLAKATGGIPIVPLTWSFLGYLITPHPLGGCTMGTDHKTSVVDHRGLVWGQPNLYVADGAIVPEALGANPSRTIATLAERIAAIIVAEGR